MLFKEFLAYNIVIFILFYLSLKAKFEACVILSIVAMLLTFQIAYQDVIIKPRVANYTETPDGNNTVTTYEYQTVVIPKDKSVFFYVGLIVCIVLNTAIKTVEARRI